MSGSALKRIFESLPPGVHRAASLVPFRYRAGKEYRKTIRELDASQWHDAEKIRREQVRRLMQVLTYASRKVPYYRDLFSAIKFDPDTFQSIEQLERIPLLTKSHVFEHYERLRSEDSNPLNSYEGYTGGTTGHPLKLLFSLRSHFWEWAFMHHQWKRVGYTPDQKRLSILGVPFRNNEVMRHKLNPLHNELQISPRHMSNNDIAFYMELIREFSPDYIYGLPSAISVLANYIAENGFHCQSVKGVLCGSEGMTGLQKQSIADAFNARVYTWYGQTEKVVLGGECEVSEAYHLFPEYGVTELVDDSGSVIKVGGVTGQIVGTGFLNSAMPLIRYCTDDYGQYKDRPCKCGRYYPLLARVVGRRNIDYIIDERNEKHTFSAVETQRGAFQSIRQWQFIQKKRGEVDVYIVPNSRFREEHLSDVEKELNSQFEGIAKFKAFLATELIRSENGKIRNFIQETHE